MCEKRRRDGERRSKRRGARDAEEFDSTGARAHTQNSEIRRGANRQATRRCDNPALDHAANDRARPSSHTGTAEADGKRGKRNRASFLVFQSTARGCAKGGTVSYREGVRRRSTCATARERGAQPRRVKGEALDKKEEEEGRTVVQRSLGQAEGCARLDEDKAERCIELDGVRSVCHSSFSFLLFSFFSFFPTSESLRMQPVSSLDSSRSRGVPWLCSQSGWAPLRVKPVHAPRRPLPPRGGPSLQTAENTSVHLQRVRECAVVAVIAALFSDSLFAASVQSLLIYASSGIQRGAQQARWGAPK